MSSRPKLRVRVAEQPSPDTYGGPGTEHWDHLTAVARNVGQRERDGVQASYLESWLTNSGYFKARFIETGSSRALAAEEKENAPTYDGLRGPNPSIVLEPLAHSEFRMMFTFFSFKLYVKLFYGVTLEISFDGGLPDRYKFRPSPDAA